MKIGTKSVLFGAHAFWLHPFLLAYAWTKLFGFPLDPRLWWAFFVHDLGYIGKPNMDGEEGESHPVTGAELMWLFDAYESYSFLGTRPHDGPVRWLRGAFARSVTKACDALWGKNAPGGYTWYCFCFYHSRFLAKKYGVRPSPLCMADKMVIVIEPAWLYLPRVRWSGEIVEYMSKAKSRNGREPGKYSAMGLRTASQREWHSDMRDYVRRWVEEHKDGREDTWTPESKQAQSDTGVWK